ncbi:MAG: sugar ABC transporter permease [Lachnospiraceae bacterium]|nr:sugar ABC transporter permease [Lachnospiraceae bacterium]
MGKKIKNAKFPKINLLKEAWKNGDLFTKLAFFILGIGNIARKQIIKGLIYLAAEVGFIFYMIMFGVTALSRFDDLGDVETGRVLDEARGVYVQTQGEDSLKLLLGAIFACIVIAIFVVMWFKSIQSSYNAQKLQEQKKRVNNFRQDLADYFDSKLHFTMLFLPVLSIMIFNILPLIYMILLAFTNCDQNHQPPGHLFDWVGFKNFGQMFNMNGKIGRTFFPVLEWTFIWAIFATFLNYILGMLLAIIINRKGTRLKPMWRTFFVITIAIPQFVSLLLMRHMLDMHGPLNGTLETLGLFHDPIPFWQDKTLARVTVIVINLWIGMPYTMLVTTGILQNIPSDLYEAARVDGAKASTIFWKITLPYMLFVTTPKLITDFVGNINNFNVIFFLTNGAPLTNDYYQAGYTDLLVTWLYSLTVNSFDYNRAAVIGIFVFIISATLSLLTYRNTASYKDEEGFS